MNDTIPHFFLCAWCTPTKTISDTSFPHPLPPLLRFTFPSLFFETPLSLPPPPPPLSSSFLSPLTHSINKNRSAVGLTEGFVAKETPTPPPLCNKREEEEEEDEQEEMRRVLRSAGRASASVGASLSASPPAAPPAATFAAGARWVTAPPPRAGPPPPPAKNWTVTFEEGRRVFRSGNERYGEQWYENEPAKGYYFKLDTKGEPVGDSIAEGNMPFKPNKVSNWQLVAEGVRWKPTGQVWTRHAAPDGTPFYSNGHITDWAPQPPLPPKPGHAQQPSHGSSAPARGNWGAEPLHSARTGGAPPSSSSNVPAVVRNSNSIADPLATGGPLRVVRQREIKQLEQMKSYTVKPCPLNPSETLPMGSYVYFMQDFKVLCTRIDNHPATKEKLTDKTLGQLHKVHCDRFQIVRWSRKQGETLGGIRVLIESTKNRGRDDVSPLSMWVPANCLVTPSKFNAHSCAKLRMSASFDVVPTAHTQSA